MSFNPNKRFGNNLDCINASESNIMIIIFNAIIKV